MPAVAGWVWGRGPVPLGSSVRRAQVLDGLQMISAEQLASVPLALF